LYEFLGAEFFGEGLRFDDVPYPTTEKFRSHQPMSHPKTLTYVKYWIVIFCFYCLGTGIAYSQATAVNNAPPGTYDPGYATQYIRHETDAQNQILVPINTTLTTAVTCAGACGFTVTIAGAGAAITSVAGPVGAKQILVNLGVSVQTGQAVTIAYSGSAGLNSFGARTSYNARYIRCTDFTFAAFNDASLNCAPVTPNSQMVFAVPLGARNSSRWSTTLTTARVSWTAINTAPQSVLQGVQTTVATPAANTAYIGFSSSNWIAPTTATYVYPNTPGVCGYTSHWNVRLQYSAANGENTNCPLAGAPASQSYASYNNDSVLPGVIALPPVVANSDEVCVGTPVSMQFMDDTDLNCNPAVSPSPANDKTRWVRVVYGSLDLGGGNTATSNIPNITVDGVPVTNASGNLLFAGGYYPKNTAALGGTADAFGVVEITQPVNANRGPLLQILTSSV